MSEETIFHKIISGDIPSDKVYEDEQCIVIKDINPQAPVHLLCIPKKFIKDAASLEQEDSVIIGQLLLVASRVAEEQGIAESGYRLVINCGDDSGMEVPYLHLHILGGQKLQGIC